MSAAAIWYGPAMVSAFSGLIDFPDDTIKVALLANTYTPDQDNHDMFADVDDYEISGTGYVAGGGTLAGKTMGYTGGTNILKFDATDQTWSATTITARYAVIYKVGADADNSPLMGLMDFGEDKVTNGQDFKIVWGADGILEIEMAAVT